MPGASDQTQTLSIGDFTPGIVRWARTGVPGSYPTAPPGSAANAYRCWAKQGIGLLPLPTYKVALIHTGTNPSKAIQIQLGNMMTLSARGGAVGDLVCAWFQEAGGGTTADCNFAVTRLPIFFSTFTPTVVYQSSTTGVSPLNTTLQPTMDYAVFEDPTSQQFRRAVITTDPISTSLATTAGPGIWVTVPGWTTPTLNTVPEASTGTFPLIGLIGSYPRVFYHEARVGIWQIGSSQTATNHFVASDADVLTVSDLRVPTGSNQAGTFYAELGTTVSAWGSWSTGEFVGVYSEGGAFIHYGDWLSTSSSVYKLAGVMGTAGATGKAALTPIGMIYPRLGEAVYLWNGDNTSQNISRQLPDGVFTRSPALFTGQTRTSQQVWGEWVAFPNNWMLDTATRAWWQLEDPGVLNFQVHCGDGTQSMFSSPGIAQAAAGETATVNVYYWDKNTAVSNWYWLSNPLAATTNTLVSIMDVEIVATNLAATDATITVQPSSPTGVIPLQNQNQAQPLVFTIPGGASAWRGSHRLGYADYNVQLAVTANNAAGNGAPTLHAVNVGYTSTRTAGIQS